MIKRDMTPLELAECRVSYSRAEAHCAQAAEERVRNKNYELQSKIAELQSALTAAQERERRLKHALVTAAVPLEVLAGQIAHHPYEEISIEFQQAIVDEVIPVVRAAISAIAASKDGKP
jgi:chromosome segregation ATPase